MTGALPCPLALKDAEREVVQRVRDGDSDAYRLLVERYQARVHRLVARLLGPDHGDVDDVVQEVFVKAFFSLNRFREDATFSTWITRIAINRARDELRKQSGRVSLDPEPGEEEVRGLRGLLSTVDSHDQETDQTDETAGDAVSGLVARTVARLPERFRVVVTLKDMEGHSYQEVGQILNCSVGTVKSRHARARERLRQLLAPHVSEFIRR